MLPSALMDTAAFQRAVGITEKQFTDAAMCGLLPKAHGIFNGVPVWAESDVRSFAAQFGYTFNSPGGEAAPTLVVVPPAGATHVTVTNNTGEAVQFRLADPAAEGDDTSPGSFDLSGAVRITRAGLGEVTLKALRKYDLSSTQTYNFQQLPPAIREALPQGLRTVRPIVKDALRAATYTTDELCAYLDINDTTLDRWREAMDLRPKRIIAGSGGREGQYEYSDAQAQRIRKSELFKAYRKRPNSTVVRNAVHTWLLAYLSEAPAKVQGDDVTPPHRTPVAQGGTAPPVEVIPPDTWLTEHAAADHLGWPLDVLRIARKERTGPLSVFRTNQIMYRVADLDAWKMANTTLVDQMKHEGDRVVDEFEAAQIVGLTVTTMRNLRNQKDTKRRTSIYLTSPAFHKQGRSFVYWVRDLEAWKRVNADTIAKRRAVASNPATIAAVTMAREALAKKRAGGESVGRGKKATKPDKVALALVAQTEARKPVAAALNKSLTNGRATFADKLDAHQQQAGKVGRKTVVKRTLAGGALRH